MSATLTPVFQALLNEAQFTRQILGSGCTQIRRANYATKGTYFLALVSLSTGIERLGKLCLMLDHYLEHGRFPDLAHLKQQIGHRLLLLYQRTDALVTRRGLQLKYRQQLSDPFHSAILDCLHRFAEGDRYSNINLLVGAPSSSDPISLWHEKVDMPLFDKHVSPARKVLIGSKARAMAQMMAGHTMVLYTSETGDTISDMENASYRTGVFEFVGPYRQLYVLQIIRYWVEVLSELQHRAMRISSDIPEFSEVLGIFQGEDAYFKSRKTWERE
ncbi:MAG: hypothetical protein E8D52_03365 [Nitrospira sp.]|nr:MAG: hypothetical protein E8D52_03365 [Nitrospira sp.]